jgi:hypothetical protein
MTKIVSDTICVVTVYVENCITPRVMTKIVTVNTRIVTMTNFVTCTRGAIGVLVGGYPMSMSMMCIGVV